jgi:hypothetical protein
VGSRRAATALVAMAATLSLVVAAADDAPFHTRPQIAFVEGVPADLQALSASTWDRFTDAFAARWSCLPDVTVAAAWRLADRATYDPHRRLVTIRIPGTAPNLRATLVHEFAHHIEFTCPEQRRLRARFLAAQGLPPGTPWFGGATWERIPSEQFAEATVQAVVGRPSLPRVLVSSEALSMIREWGRGR